VQAASVSSGCKDQFDQQDQYNQCSYLRTLRVVLQPPNFVGHGPGGFSRRYAEGAAKAARTSWHGRHTCPHSAAARISSISKISLISVPI